MGIGERCSRKHRRAYDRLPDRCALGDFFSITDTSMSNLSMIRILGAEIYARHGVGEAERSIGGRYSFDIDIEADISAAAASDHLEDTVNYQEAYELARDILTGTNRRLLESLVVAIADALLNRFPVAQSVTVRLRKLSVPIDGVMRAVEVETRRERGLAHE